MKEEQIIRRIAADLQILPKQVKAALALLAAGNTVPFIARYRKEATGLLNEVQLRSIQERFDYERALSARKETVEQAVKEQGLWTEELAAALEKAAQIQEVEDIYLPYKPKKRTRASMAREAGLEPLAGTRRRGPGAGRSRPPVSERDRADGGRRDPGSRIHYCRTPVGAYVIS